jgi:hypothetical protein
MASGGLRNSSVFTETKARCGIQCPNLLLSPPFAILHVCALHEHEHTRSRSSLKIPKMQIFFWLSQGMGSFFIQRVKVPYRQVEPYANEAGVEA